MVVSHPKRRRIIGWLIFLGNAGIISFIILVIVFVRVGLKAPSPYYLGILLGVVALIALLIKLKVIDKLTSSLIRLARGRRPIPLMVTEELLYQNADYGVAHIAVGEKAGLADTKLKDTGLFKLGITVLAIERGREVIPSPKPEETVLAGDYLLCYGKVTVMTNVAR